MRVTAAFDIYDEVEVHGAMQKLGLDPIVLTCVYCGELATC